MEAPSAEDTESMRKIAEKRPNVDVAKVKAAESADAAIALVSSC